jgi:hypothetical protein
VRHDWSFQRAKETAIRDLERRIDELYSGPPGAFVAGRDALAAELKGSGDVEDARRVKALRRPVVSAWALNRLAHEDPKRVAELAELGARLRIAHRRALSGGEAEELRVAMEDRRRMVAALMAEAARILEQEGIAPGPHEDDLRSTLEAAVADEEAGRLVLAGRVVRPLRPPAEIGGGGDLQLLPGGRRDAEAVETPKPDRERRAELAKARRQLASAEAARRRAAGAVDRARRRLEELEAKRGGAREDVRRAQAELRGATLEAKRFAAAVAKLERTS